MGMDTETPKILNLEVCLTIMSISSHSVHQTMLTSHHFTVSTANRISNCHPYKIKYTKTKNPNKNNRTIPLPRRQQMLRARR